MKKFISLFLATLIIISFAACTNNKTPSDKEIKAAYQQAVEAYSWFDLTTMPLEDNSGVEYDGNFYMKVNYNNIKTRSDLEKHLHKLFSTNIVASLLKNNRYIDINDSLYAIPADRGADISVGEESHEIIRENDKKIIYKVTVEILDIDSQAVVDEKVYSFNYEFIDNKWLFTNFNLVR